MKKIALILVFFALQSSRLADNQNITITGHITDSQNGAPLPGVNIIEKGTSQGAITDVNGFYSLLVKSEKSVLIFSYVGFITERIVVGSKRIINVAMNPDNTSLQEVVVFGYGVQGGRNSSKRKEASVTYDMAIAPSVGYMVAEYDKEQFNTEGYSAIHESGFLKSIQNPLSTFSIDVDVASYANMRRYLNHGQRPPIDAIRIEEMVNYFTYSYPQPDGEDPFSVITEVATCPWNESHQLIHIGLQGKRIPTENLPASNLVFLIDVSGSMNTPERLPLVKSAFKMLVNELRPQDRVAIVVYAGAAGLVLPSTSGKDKNKIIQAIEQLEAGGSTAGGAGIKLAYEVALQNMVKGGNNRIILATDGDFNVGVSSNAEMERLIEQKRNEGVFLTVLGFGMGNYKDDKMEILADKGNGNYAYIDNLQEAKKVFVNEFAGTLFTIAKDVKLQVEFNPTVVQAYRLIGYENRRLNNEDFNDDKKDAGELGSGHTVTALYEVIPVGVKSDFVKSVDPLKYQKNDTLKRTGNGSELLTLKLRYKLPEGDQSSLMSTTVLNSSKEWKNATDNFRWSAAVAAYGMLLRESEYAQKTNLQLVLDLARNSKGRDEEGYRSEFIRLVESTRFLAEIR